MKANNSERSKNEMKTMHEIDMNAPVFVGWVRSLGILRYISNLLIGKKKEVVDQSKTIFR